MSYRIATDESCGHRLFDGIQKQPAARKPSHHLGMNGRNQGVQAGVRKLPAGAKLDLAIWVVSGGDQCCVGNTELQVPYVHESDPLADMTIAQRQIARRIIELFERGTLRAPLN
jgi:hypothetical protein